jgi:hypothetical protein
VSGISVGDPEITGAVAVRVVVRVAVAVVVRVAVRVAVAVVVHVAVRVALAVVVRVAVRVALAVVVRVAVVGGRWRSDGILRWGLAHDTTRLPPIGPEKRSPWRLHTTRRAVPAPGSSRWSWPCSSWP